MTTLSDIRSALRTDLKDTDSANYRWTDGELDRHIAVALKELSRSMPVEQKTALATTAGSRQVSLASLGDVLVVQAVEYPTGRFPSAYQRFSLYDGVITLLGEDVPDGSNCIVYFGAPQTLDASGCTLAAAYQDILTFGASAYALLAYAAYSLNRINTGGKDSPTDFRNEGERRLSIFREELRRHAARNRVRTSRLYTPHEPAKSRTTDWGPA